MNCPHCGEPTTQEHFADNASTRSPMIETVTYCDTCQWFQVERAPALIVVINDALRVLEGIPA